MVNHIEWCVLRCCYVLFLWYTYGPISFAYVSIIVSNKTVWHHRNHTVFSNLKRNPIICLWPQNSLQDQITNPKLPLVDFTKDIRMRHVAFCALHQFRDQHGRLPKLRYGCICISLSFCSKNLSFDRNWSIEMGVINLWTPLAMFLPEFI